MTVLVGIIPWFQTGLRGSPFVLVYDVLGIPGASDVMNLVVLTAALWLMIALSHIEWRSRVTAESSFKAPFYPYLSILVAILLVGFIAALWAMPEERVGIYIGLSALLVLSAAYGLQRLSYLPRVEKLLPRSLMSLMRPRVAAGAIASIGSALAMYFGLVSKEIEG